MAILMLSLLLFAPCAQAEMYDADLAGDWLGQFAQALCALSPLNDPQETTDPARAGQALAEYEFGTVLLDGAGSILEINVRTDQVTDCRGVRVGMGLEEATGGIAVSASGASLHVLCTQEAGIGWSWAYLSENGVYGVEHITYGAAGAQMKEYTLTYVIDENQTISAIRMRIADATAAQAESGFATAQEIAQRQNSEVIIKANDEQVFDRADMQVMGAQALFVQVAQLISVLGEPAQVQTLPEGRGRMLLYDGAVAELTFDEYTGVEMVSGVTVSSASVAGPRGLKTGMTLAQAAALFACQSPMTGAGGTLYLAGEALGEPPYGEMVAISAQEQVLRYVSSAQDGVVGILEIGVENGVVTYWHLYESGLEAEHANNG